MSRENLIRIAREARMPYFYQTLEIANLDALERFANLIRADKWVGLTDDEIKEIIGPYGDAPIKGYTRKLFDQIEAALKEKNT